MKNVVRALLLLLVCLFAAAAAAAAANNNEEPSSALLRGNQNKNSKEEEDRTLQWYSNGDDGDKSDDYDGNYVPNRGGWDNNDKDMGYDHGYDHGYGDQGYDKDKDWDRQASQTETGTDLPYGSRFFYFSSIDFYVYYWSLSIRSLYIGFWADLSTLVRPFNKRS